MQYPYQLNCTCTQGSYWISFTLRAETGRVQDLNVHKVFRVFSERNDQAVVRLIVDYSKQSHRLVLLIFNPVIDLKRK